MNQRIKFLEDLLSLVEKYEVEFHCYDDWGGYPECGQNMCIMIEFDDSSMPAIDFATYIDIDKIKQMIKSF